MSRIEFIGYLGHKVGPRSKEVILDRVRLQNDPCFKARGPVMLRPLVRVRIFSFLVTEHRARGYREPIKLFKGDTVTLLGILDGMPFFVLKWFEFLARLGAR